MTKTESSDALDLVPQLTTVIIERQVAVVFALVVAQSVQTVQGGEGVLTKGISIS